MMVRINQNILHMYVTWIECMAFVMCMQWHVIMQSDMHLPTCSTNCLLSWFISSKQKILPVTYHELIHQENLFRIAQVYAREK